MYCSSERPQTQWTDQNLYLVTISIISLVHVWKILNSLACFVLFSEMNLMTRISIRDKNLWRPDGSRAHRWVCACVKHYEVFPLCLHERGTMMEAFTCWPAGVNQNPQHRSRISLFGWACSPRTRSVWLLCLLVLLWHSLGFFGKPYRGGANCPLSPTTTSLILSLHW